ncbi:MAG: NAD(P)/FAD-dependent oxidoreductase [Archangiaceae bacterium]|nr:NAD(P)/FAD-dependent oxidoreductase [Archangiaceae bacterium]
MGARQHVVIVGGGFGGLYAARRLARERDVDVTVVDKQNYHLFQPLLYQVATAGLSAGDIASPIRGILRKTRNVTVHMGEAAAVNLAAKTLQLSDGASLSYDHLILAAGVRHSYFGHTEWERFAPGLKSIDDALEMRRRVLLAFERAEVEPDPKEREALLTFVVVGGGPTGVELAGALSELSRFTFARDFHNIDPSRARIVLVEAGPRVVPAFREKLSQKALESLQKLGVEVRLGTLVTKVDEHGVMLGGEALPARTVLWAAGVEASPLAKSLGVPLDRAGRVVVNEDLSLPGHPEVYCIGDLSSFKGPDGHPLPGLAPVAIQQGKHVGENVAAAVRGNAKKPFTYFDKGTMATIGRAAGIAQSGKLELWGLLGWLGWLFIHVIFLIGFRNRLLVLLEWTWAYATYQRGARLIIGHDSAEAAPAPAQLPAPRQREAVPVRTQAP